MNSGSSSQVAPNTCRAASTHLDHTQEQYVPFMLQPLHLGRACLLVPQRRIPMTACQAYVLNETTENCRHRALQLDLNQHRIRTAYMKC